MATTDLHASAQAAFAKSADYDQHRPTYPPSIVDTLLDRLRVAGKTNARILDLGAGTGKLTESLAVRPEQFAITAIDPHADMRRVLADKHLPRVTVLDGSAQRLPLDDGSVDAVVVAQAFHWFATMPALREIHRVLQPHGVLGMVWNLEDYNAPRARQPTTAWEAKVKDALWQVAEASADQEPRFRHMQWRNVFDEQIKSTPLSLITAGDDQLFSLPLGEQEEPFEMTMSKAAAWERFSTLGHIAPLDGDTRKHIHQVFHDAINGDDVATAANGDIVIHGYTYAAWTSKIPEEGRQSLFSVERS